MVIDRNSILVLNEPVKCSDCHCDCHCDEELHVPSDELDTGGPCGCDECKCNYSKDAQRIVQIKQWVIVVNI